MLAAYYGHADVVKFLIQNGADPNRLNDKRQSPLAGAVFKKLDDVAQVGLIWAFFDPTEPHLYHHYTGLVVQLTSAVQS